MPLRLIDTASRRSALSFSIILTSSASDAAWDPSHDLSALNLPLTASRITSRSRVASN
jgi:hypothetical protein